MDIIANHTADVLYPTECEGKAQCPYRSIADYPYQRRGGHRRRGDQSRASTAANFAKLTDPNFAYTVKVQPAERNVKVPAWLNDPIYYHNRGDTTFNGEVQHDGRFRRARRPVHRASARRRRA